MLVILRHKLDFLIFKTISVYLTELQLSRISRAENSEALYASMSTFFGGLFNHVILWITTTNHPSAAAEDPPTIELDDFFGGTSSDAEEVDLVASKEPRSPLLCTENWMALV